jgi:SAM-dependent methyltransferase
MISVKRIIKDLFIKSNSLVLLDRFNFKYSYFKYLAKNRKYKKENADFIFPPDYYLYETYKLDYEQYKVDGEIAAQEIIEWTCKYIKGQIKILEWGCGVARIIRHIPNLINNNSIIFGTDINEEMVKWNTNNIKNVDFQKNDYYPPTMFEDSQFNIVFALSVFTHIEADYQAKWLAEIARIISDDGIFLFTTHGKKYEINLSENEKKILNTKGAITINYKQKGHRMMTTYNSYENFKIIVEDYFDILEYYHGEEHLQKVGGQDLWIVRKRDSKFS